MPENIGHAKRKCGPWHESDQEKMPKISTLENIQEKEPETPASEAPDGKEPSPQLHNSAQSLMPKTSPQRKRKISAEPMTHQEKFILARKINKLTRMSLIAFTRQIRSKYFNLNGT